MIIARVIRDSDKPEQPLVIILSPARPGFEFAGNLVPMTPAALLISSNGGKLF
jgi:hypothetical protein